MKIYFLPGGRTESSLSIQMWTECRDSLPKNRMWEGKNSNFSVKETGRHHSNQIICNILPQNPYSKSNDEQNIRKSKCITVYKIPTLCFSKLSRPLETRKG